MKILTLEIVNFLAIGNSGRLNLDNQGLVLIQGINKDDTSASSNGVGKSSIPDALSWVNFGKTARDETGDAIVNTVAKKNCMVRVVVQSGENEYAIERYRKHATYKNQTRVLVRTAGSETEVFTDISKGTEKETQALIEQILGCSEEVFMAAIYCGQETAPDIPKMTDKELKLLIEEAAGVAKIESALVIARARASSNNAQIVSAATTLEHQKTRLLDTEERIRAAKERRAAFETDRPNRRAVHLNQAKVYLTEGTALSKKLPEPDVHMALNVELAGINEKLADHSKLVSAADAKYRLYVDAQRGLDKRQNELDSKMIEVQRVKKAIENAPEEMKKPCIECGKPHTESELEEFVSHLKAKFATEAAKAKILVAGVNEAKVNLAAALAASNEAAALVPDVIAITGRRAKIVEFNTEASRTAERVENYKKMAKTEMANVEYVMKTPNPHDEELAIAEHRLTDLSSDITGYEINLEKLKKRQVVLDETVKVFGPAGVRAHILDTVTPFLNVQTADYLSAMSDGNITATWSTLAETSKGELREKFNIDVTNDKGAKTFKGLSGGEKRKVRLATMFALQDLVATRASNPIQLWIGDEIDDALDKSGLERLMGVLERKARERGTVLIISHNDLTDWADRTAVVVKEGGRSSVSGALS